MPCSGLGGLALLVLKDSTNASCSRVDDTLRRLAKPGLRPIASRQLRTKACACHNHLSTATQQLRWHQIVLSVASTRGLTSYLVMLALTKLVRLQGPLRDRSRCLKDYTAVADSKVFCGALEGFQHPASILE